MTEKDTDPNPIDPKPLPTKGETIMDAIDSGEVKGGARKPKELLAQVDMAPLLEQLASVEHARWADWQSYFMSKLDRLEDGRLAIPVEYDDALRGLIETPYADLEEAMKEADRKEVQRYWTLVEAFFAGLE